MNYFAPQIAVMRLDTRMCRLQSTGGNPGSGSENTLLIADCNDTAQEKNWATICNQGSILSFQFFLQGPSLSQSEILTACSFFIQSNAVNEAGAFDSTAGGVAFDDGFVYNMQFPNNSSNCTTGPMTMSCEGYEVAEACNLVVIQGP